jgi:hypothetical protein
VDRSQASDGAKSALPYKLFSVGPDGQPDNDDDIKMATESDTSGSGGGNAGGNTGGAAK